MYEIIFTILILSSLVFILSRFTQINLTLSNLFSLNKEKVTTYLQDSNKTTFFQNSYFNGNFNVPIFSGIVDINKSYDNKVYLSASKLLLLQSPITIKFKNHPKKFEATIIDNSYLELNQTFVIEKEILIIDKI